MYKLKISPVPDGFEEEVELGFAKPGDHILTWWGKVELAKYPKARVILLKKKKNSIKKWLGINLIPAHNKEYGIFQVVQNGDRYDIVHQGELHSVGYSEEDVLNHINGRSWVLAK